MEAVSFRSALQQRQLRILATVLCLVSLLLGNSSCSSKTTPQAQQPAGSPPPAQTPANQQSANDSANQQPAKILADQLDSLVAPIALYPDPLLSQVLVASTYPLEIIQLQQWLEKNKNFKDKALVNEVSKQPWDPSIQAMAALPEVVKRLADDIQWTTDLGNAFLAQQSDVMDAIQRMRQKAQGTGALRSNEQLRVESRVVQEKTVIVIEQANPEVVYVPIYDPVYVYGAPVYPYPAIYYPAYPTGTVVAAAAISFGVGLALGAAWGGGWGWGCGWGDNDIDINVNNNFNRNTNISGGNRINNINGGNKWQHNPRHRGGAPYPNRTTADRFGGTARGDSLANRQRAANKQLARRDGNLSSDKRGSASDRAAAGNRDRDAGRAEAKNRSRAANRGGSAVGERASSRGETRASDRSRSTGNRASGGGDRVGSRNVGRSSEGRGAFGDGSGYSGSGARSSSNRGASSMGGSRGGFGGGSRGGGGGGGGRGGGRR
jgi:Protein of unknown function (DUF3300)